MPELDDGPAGPVRAAGAVLWRPGPDGPLVAVVHRPKYDDWSLPKGKVDRGEHLLTAARREVREETGHDGALGRPLGELQYRVAARGTTADKTVRYWAMRSAGGRFVPGAEVDALEWLPPEEAGRRLSYERDTRPLRRFAAGPAETTTVLLVRHARAGERAAFPGDDRLRPLDDAGRRQAERIAEVLQAFGPRRVVSADRTRCVETVHPLANALGLAVEIEPAFAEEAYQAHPARALRCLLDYAGTGESLVVSSQGGAIPGLVEELGARAGLRLRPKAKKASVWALSFDGMDLVDAEYFESLDGDGS